MAAQPVSQRFTTILMFVVAVYAAAAIGAWRSISPSQTEAAEQHSAFVQSGGVTTDADPSVPDAAQALSHARARNEPEVAPPTF